MQFSQVDITPDSSWAGKTVKELSIPKNLLLCLDIKKNGERVVPDAKTTIETRDTVIICAITASEDVNIHIMEYPISENSKWIGRMVKEYPRSENEQLIR